MSQMQTHTIKSKSWIRTCVYHSLFKPRFSRVFGFRLRFCLQNIKTKLRRCWGVLCPLGRVFFLFLLWPMHKGRGGYDWIGYGFVMGGLWGLPWVHCVGLEFWVLWFFFFFWWPMHKGRGEYGWIGYGLILMVAALSFFVSMVELALKRKKKDQVFFQVLVGSCSGFGLMVGEWERGKENRDEERREREIFYIILLYNLYYFNMLYCKIKVGMLRIL